VLTKLTTMSADLDADLDRLYRAAPTAFVAARNDLARALKQAGKRAESDIVARMTRPTPASWAVNQLHFSAPAELKALEAAGAALKRVQESSGASEDFARRKREHQSSLRVAADLAMKFAEGSGVAPTVTLRRRIETTLNLLSANGNTEPRPGRLSVDLEPVGFDTLTLAAPTEPTPEPKLTKAEATAEKKRLDQARRTVAELESRVAELEHEASADRTRREQATKAAEEAAKRADEALRSRDEARRTAEGSQARLDDLRAQLEQGQRTLRLIES
jgi:hypothetical protein